MATRDEKIWEKAQIVLDSGVYAAKGGLESGMSEAEVLRMMSAGLEESAMEGSGPRAVLDLLSAALVRLAQHQIDLAELMQGMVELREEIAQVGAQNE